MSLKLEIINPLNFYGWDKLILSIKEYSFYYSSAWARVLYESYQYKPIYLTLFDNNKILVLIPLMEVKSFITGKRCVSLPFTDYVEPYINNTIQFEEVFNYIIKFGIKSKWKYINFKGWERYLQNIEPSIKIYIHNRKTNIIKFCMQ